MKAKIIWNILPVFIQEVTACFSNFDFGILCCFLPFCCTLSAIWSSPAICCKLKSSSFANPEVWNVSMLWLFMKLWIPRKLDCSTVLTLQDSNIILKVKAVSLQSIHRILFTHSHFELHGELFFFSRTKSLDKVLKEAVRHVGYSSSVWHNWTRRSVAALAASGVFRRSNSTFNAGKAAMLQVSVDDVLSIWVRSLISWSCGHNVWATSEESFVIHLRHVASADRFTAVTSTVALQN